MKIKKALTLAVVVGSPLSLALATIVTPKALLVLALFVPASPISFLLVPFVAPFFDELVGIIILLGAVRLFDTGDMLNIIIA